MILSTVLRASSHLVPPGGGDVPLGRWLLRGAAAGAAGTTALDAATYLDMVVRGRAPSSTPEQGVEKLAAALHLTIPGDRETRQHRVAGLGPLLGAGVGTGAGVLLGAAHAAGFRPPLPLGSLVTAVGVMVGTNAPMAVLRISDPRSWSPSDWLSDALPHAVYGLVTAWTLRELGARGRPRLR